MNKLLFVFIALSGLVHAASPMRPTLTPVESKSKEIGGLEFSTVTQSEWKPMGQGVQSRIVVQLRITNHGTTPILFPTFDTLMAMLKMPDGKEVALAGNRDFTTVTENILLNPGAGFSYELIADVISEQETQKITLHFADHTGGGSRTVLPPGAYSIAFRLSPDQYGLEQHQKLSAPLWKGEGTTESVSFQVVTPDKEL